MADIMDLEDNLYDIFEAILDPAVYQLAWSDQEMPELPTHIKAYVTIEVEDLQQVGRAHVYDLEDNPDDADRPLQRTRTEWESPLVFTAIGVDAKKALLSIARSHNREMHRYLLSDKGIAIRSQGGVRSTPVVIGASNEPGAQLVLNMGVSDIYTEEMDFIEVSTITGVVDTHTSEVISITLTGSAYERAYGIPIDSIFKDYHLFSGDYDHTIDLGVYGEVITATHDGGTYT